VVVTVRNGEYKVTTGGLIPEPLELTPNPNVDESDLVLIPGTAVRIDKDLLWTVDFDAAKQVGMAIEVPLSGPVCQSAPETNVLRNI
jgi:hypothetical protein